MSPALSGGIDGVTMFKGRVSTVDRVGRTSAQITVASPLVVLDFDMPRNSYSPTCLHTLYDLGCGLNALLYQFNGDVGAGSTSTVILGAGALANHTQGSFLFLNGANGGIRTSVKSAVPGVSWTLRCPAPGDAGDRRQLRRLLGLRPYRPDVLEHVQQRRELPRLPQCSASRIRDLTARGRARPFNESVNAE